MNNAEIEIVYKIYYCVCVLLDFEYEMRAIPVMKKIWLVDNSLLDVIKPYRTVAL